MAHDYSDLFPYYPYSNVTQDAGPLSLPTLSAGEYVIGAIPDCQSCGRRQTENHTTRHSWCVTNTDGTPYFGANPTPVASRPRGLWNLLSRMQELLDRKEKWSWGWWANMFGTYIWNVSIYNAQDYDGTFYYNFIDIFWVTATISGNTATVDVSSGDARRWYGEYGPIQVGDLCLIGGNNMASMRMPYIIPGGTTITPSAGLIFSKPTSLTLKLSQNLDPAVNTAADPSQAHSITVGIGREASIPQKWTNLLYPDYFYGVKKTVTYTTSSPEWSGRIFSLKNEAGSNCCVAAPNPSPFDGEETLTVRIKDAATQAWSSASVSGYQGTARRSVLYASNLNVSATTTLTLKLKSAAVVTAGMFSTDAGALSNFSGSLTTYTIDLSFAGVSKQPVTVTFAPGTLIDAFGAQVDGASLQLLYDDSAPVPTLTAIDDDEDAHSYQAWARLEFSDLVRGLVGSDLLLNNCSLDYLVRLAGNLYDVCVYRTPGGATPTIQVNASAVSNDNGQSNVASNQLSLDTVASAGIGCRIASTAAFVTATSPIPCTLTFDEDMDDVTESMFTLTHCKMENFTKVDAQSYTFDILPKEVTWDDDEEELVYEAVTETTVSVELPASSVTSLDYGDPNLASNLFVRQYLTGSFDADLTQYVTTSTSAVAAGCSIQFEREVIDFTASKLWTLNCSIKNFRADETSFTWDMIPTAAGYFSCGINANQVHDIAGNGNRAAFTTAVQYVADGVAVATNARLYITHAFAASGHSGAVSQLHMGDEVGGRPGYQDLLADADAMEVTYYWETTEDDYANERRIIYSSRCRYSIPDKGGMWGVAGHEGNGWRWICSLMRQQPSGLSNYASKCYLCGTCNKFTALQFADYLTPTTTMETLYKVWCGYPGALDQIIPGIAHRFNWKWTRVTNPSITGFLTPVAWLKNHYMPGVAHWHPQGCGNFGHLTDSGEFVQGAALQHFADANDAPTDLQTPYNGALPRQISGWGDAKKKQRVNALHDNESDPCGSFRRWWGKNAWCTYRDGAGVVSTDQGPVRYRSHAHGATIAEDLLIGNIDPDSSALQAGTQGEYQHLWLDEDLNETVEGSAYYGAVVHLLPMPWKGESGISPTGIHLIRRIESITGGYRIHVQPKLITGTQGMVIPGWGQLTSVRYWYTGGNAAGWPENMRSTNEGVDYLNTYSHLFCALGAEKGIREGMVIQFLAAHYGSAVAWQVPYKWTAYGSAPSYTPTNAFKFLLPMKYSGTNIYTSAPLTYKIPRGFEVKKCSPCAGDQFGWDQAQYPPLDAPTQQQWFEDYVETCLGNPANYGDWGNYCDIIEVADPDGFIAAKITSLELGAGSVFCAMNGYATFNSAQNAPTFYYTAYESSSWTEIDSDTIDCIDPITGVYAIRKDTYDAMAALGSNICIRAACPSGRISYTPFMDAESLNEPVEALEALDTISCPVVSSQRSAEAYGEYAMVTYALGPYASPPSVGGWPGVKKWTTGYNLSAGVGRWGDPMYTNSTGPVLDYLSGYAAFLSGYPYTVDLVGGVSGMGAGYHATSSTIFPDYISMLLQRNHEIRLIDPVSVTKMFPDCVTSIDAAWANMKCSADRIVLTTVNAVIKEYINFACGQYYHVWDPYDGTISEEQRVALGLPEGMGLPTLGRDITYDSDTDPARTMHLRLIGLTPAGSLVDLETGVGVLSDNTEHRTDVTSLISTIFSQRNAGYTFGLLLTQAGELSIPTVSVTGYYNMPDGSLLIGLEWDEVDITAPSCVMTDLHVKFSVSNADGYLLGGGQTGNLPRLD